MIAAIREESPLAVAVDIGAHTAVAAGIVAAICEAAEESTVIGVMCIVAAIQEECIAAVPGEACTVAVAQEECVVAVLGDVYTVGGDVAVFHPAPLHTYYKS